MFFINCWFTNASGLSILMAKITWTTEITNENVKNMFSNHVCNSRYFVFFLCSFCVLIFCLFWTRWLYWKLWLNLAELDQRTEKKFLRNKQKNIFTYRSDSCPQTSLFTETCPYWREVLQGGGKNTWVEKFPHVQFCVILRKRLNALISDMCEFSWIWRES